MKLICKQENLNRALGIAGKISSKSSTLPILNNILLKTEKGGLKLTSTNLELGVNCWIGAKIEEEGEITVPTKLFSSLASSLPSGNVEMKLKDDVLNIKCNGYKTNIKGISSKEYPITPKIETESIFKVNCSDFKRAFVQVLPSVSNSESRIEITGVFLNFSELNNGKITLVATDSYRLSEKSIILKKDDINKNYLNLLEGIESVILPKEAAQELVRDMYNEDEFAEIAISERQIFFKFGNVSIISRLIEGKYPDYKYIIPKNFKSKIKINKEDFVKAIKVTSLFASFSNNVVELKLSSKSRNIEIAAESSDLGSNSAKVPAEIEGEDLNVKYNYKFLMDGLNNINGEFVDLNVNDENLPTVMSSKDDEGFLYVIMPTRS